MEPHPLFARKINQIGNNQQMLPRDQWPMWAQILATQATPEDKGIGDVLYRIIGPENSEAFKAWYKKTTGKDCGCTGRQKRWNQMYPLNEAG